MKYQHSFDYLKQNKVWGAHSKTNANESVDDLLIIAYNKCLNTTNRQSNTGWGYFNKETYLVSGLLTMMFTFIKA